MEYKVVITSDAEDDLDEFIRYLFKALGKSVFQNCFCRSHI